MGTIAVTMETRRDPLDWKTIILTQWSQVGIMGLIYVFLPETPWWYARKGRAEDAKKILTRLYGKIQGYDVSVEYGIIAATVEQETIWATENKEVAWSAIFKGINGVRGTRD